jgi:hypothetical protein
VDGQLISGSAGGLGAVLIGCGAHWPTFLGRSGGPALTVACPYGYGMGYSYMLRGAHV